MAEALGRDTKSGQRELGIEMGSVFGLEKVSGAHGRRSRQRRIKKR